LKDNNRGCRIKKSG